jgi:error-prone DNA polymerase
MSEYVELHCHSNFSFLDGASHVEELVLKARELGYPALALTDHNGLYGSMEFAQSARAQELKPITGAEITLESGHHLTLLAENGQGYANLCRLLSHAHLTNEKGVPTLDRETLAQHTAGLIALSGCRHGEVPSLVAEERFHEAEIVANSYAELFGPQNFFIELQQNLVHGDTPRNRHLIDLAKRLDLGAVATNNVHYHVRERHRLQDVLVAIKRRTTLEESHALRRPNSEFHLKSAEEMERLFDGCPAALTNTLRIAERCHFDLTTDLNYHFPDYPVPDGHTPDSVLRALCQQALRNRYAHNQRPAAQERLDEELGLIAKHRLAGFFLIYIDILELAKEVAREVYGPDHGDRPPGRGRGSSVGSIVCYLIGLSSIDPVANNLFVGRFLNEDLGSVPDIDLDFSREVREKLILRMYEHYGPERVGLVCTFPTYRLRSATRDIGKVLGLPEAELARLAKLVGYASADQIEEEMSRYPEFKRRLNAPLWRDLVGLAGQIKGFPRHVSQHVGGMIISSSPLVEIVPLERSRMEGRVLCQWDKDSVDDARMIKVDFLALGMLSLVDYCLDEIDVTHPDDHVDLSRIDFEDEAVYDMICEGDTIGIFQVESRAQAQSLPRTRPRTLDDLTAQVAIIRPGPIVGKAVSPYILRRQGKEEVTYDHPDLEPILKETMGVTLYQEQVLQVAMAIGNFSAGQANELRRAMSRKRSSEEMAKMRQDFYTGALARGIDEEIAERVFTTLLGFAEFGFPKSHSAAFALLAYQSAWLRKYYPVEFNCSLLNAQPMGFYSPEVIIGDARRHGVRFLPVDINSSRWRCTVEDGAVRIGLRYVKSIGQAGGKAVETARDLGGLFRSVHEFCWRTRLRRESVENLIRAGAFDSLGLNRRELLWQLGLVWQRAGAQMPLSLPTKQDEVSLEDFGRWERLVAGYQVLGFSTDDHPMSIIRPTLDSGISSTVDLDAINDGAQVRVAGLVVCRQRPSTASGFLFLSLEDEYGLMNVIVRPKVYERYRAVARTVSFLTIGGQMQRHEGVTNIIAASLVPMNVAHDLLAPQAHSFR